MLAERGIEWSGTELDQHYSAYINACDEWNAVAGEKSYDGLYTQKVVSYALGVPFPPKGCSDEQIHRFEAVESAKEVLKPLFECVEAYRRVLSDSIRLSALSYLPVTASPLTPLRLPAASDGSEALKLFRVACRQLRRVPIGTTLRETLALSASPEAAALRGKITEWTMKLRDGDVEEAALVTSDYEKARLNLLGAKRLSRAGEILTYISVPIGGALDLSTGFISGGLLTGLGIGMSAAGTIALGVQKKLEHSNKWAMYGNLDA
jgi:hypothetical protein